MSFLSNDPERAAPPLEEQGTLQHILHNDAAAAVILLTAAVVAFVAANTDLVVAGRSVSDWYAWLWHLELGLFLPSGAAAKSLHHWVNDGLMAIFFFVVGLEIKRELVVGELASLRKAMLPIAAALGGMLVPAMLYTLFNWGGEGAVGWGIPMATDIAFAAGVLGLLSKRIPNSLSIFLIALAIVDDLGAVLVIALFYTEQLHMAPLLIGFALLALSYVLSQLHVRSAVVFGIIAVLVWLTFFRSGVHATIAGVLLAFTIPVNARYKTHLFDERVGELLKRFKDADDAPPRMVSERQQDLVRSVERECLLVEAPLQRLEAKLHPWTAFVIMPLFAAANAGVEIEFGSIGQLLLEPVTLGVMVGLVVGKQGGIMVFSWLAVKLRLAELPAHVGWKQVYGLSWLAAIGFTMSLFIADLAFGGGHGGEGGAYNEHLTEAKTGILLGSLVAAVFGTLYLYFVTGGARQDAAQDQGSR